MFFLSTMGIFGTFVFGYTRFHHHQGFPTSPSHRHFGSTSLTTRVYLRTWPVKNGIPNDQSLKIEKKNFGIKNKKRASPDYFRLLWVPCLEIGCFRIHRLNLNPPIHQVHGIWGPWDTCSTGWTNPPVDLRGGLGFKDETLSQINSCSRMIPLKVS